MDTIDEKLKEIFILEMKDRISKLKEFEKQQDLKSVRMMGHKISGTGGSFGFSEVSKMGAAIELAARQRNWQTIESGIADLVCWYESNDGC